MLIISRRENSHVYRSQGTSEASDVPDESIGIVFDRHIKDAKTLADVVASFKRIALDRLPMPGVFF